jgi:hypothetical protein
MISPANKYKYRSGSPGKAGVVISNPSKTEIELEKNPRNSGPIQNQTQIYSIIAAPATTANNPPETRFTTPAPVLVVGTAAAEVLDALVLDALLEELVVETTELEAALELELELEVVMVVGVAEVALEVVVWVLVVVEVRVEVAVLVVAEAVDEAATAPATVKRGEKL